VAQILLCLGLAATARFAAGVAAEDVVQSCPAAAYPPSIHRRSIAITGDVFGEGTMDTYPGTIILRVHGSPYQMGYQHGAMLREAIQERIAGMRGRGGMGVIGAARALADYYRLPGAAREEIKGMARGAGIAILDLVALNSEDQMLHGGGAERPARDAEPGPDWMVVIYHPAGGQKIAAIGRPGSVGVLAGMREQSCCLAIDASGEGADPAGLRRSLGMGLCDQDPDKVSKSCNATVSAAGGEISVRLDAAAGILCLSADAGKTWSAVDMATESWRPDCGACGK